MSYATFVNVVAGLAAVAVAVFAGVTVLDADPAPTTVTVTKRTLAPDGKVTEETTTKPSDDSAFEKVLARDGDVILGLALIALAGFLGGAVVQRVLLARYAFKAVGIEVPDISAAASESAASVADLRQTVEKLAATADKAANDAAEALAVAIDAFDVAEAVGGGEVR